MITTTQDIDSLSARLDRMENENRRLKRLVLGAALVGASLFSMGQTRPGTKTVPKVIEAEKFVLKDPSGEERATLKMNGTMPQLMLIQELVPGKTQASAISLGPTGIMMLNTTDTGFVKGDIGAAGLNFDIVEKEDEREIKVSAVGPAISIKDKQGFRTNIGSVDLVSKKNGESHKTSAASIVIFDKAGSVIWKVPLD